MDEAFFGRLVEDSRTDIGADTERVAQALLRRLRTLRPSAIERFQELCERAQDDYLDDNRWLPRPWEHSSG